MPRPDDDAVTEEKSYRDWLADALARDEETWAAVERQLRRLRLKKDDASESAPRES